MTLAVTDTNTLQPPGSWLDTLVRPRLFAPLLALVNLSVSAWYLKYRFAGSDSGAILTNASKILNGGIFYRDIDAYPFPAAPYLLSLAFRLFGEHITVARSLAAVLFCIAVLSLYAVALRLVGRRAAALFGLSLLSFKFIAWPSFTAFNYWDTSFCFGVASIALFMGHRFQGGTPRLAGAGFCVALALAAKQSVGLYLGATTGILLLFPGLLGIRREKPGQR